MTDIADMILSERFAAEGGLLPGPDFADVRRRARMLASTAPRASERVAWTRRRLLVVVAAAVVGVGGAAGALAYRYLGPSPGFTAGLSAFDQLPRAEWPASMPRVGLEHAAAYVGISPAEAEMRLRRLQTGRTQGDLYAFQGPNGTVCVFLSGRFGDCLDEANAPRSPGVMATLSPGYPHESPAVVAIVADNVERVTLVDSGRRNELPIINNSVYADLTAAAPSDTISLEARYADGSTRTFPLLNTLSGSPERTSDSP